VQDAIKYDKEYKRALHGDTLEESESEKKNVSGGKTVLDWMKDCNFYLHGVVYTMVRVSMVVTVSM